MQDHSSELFYAEDWEERTELSRFIQQSRNESVNNNLRNKRAHSNFVTRSDLGAILMPGRARNAYSRVHAVIVGLCDDQVQVKRLRRLQRNHASLSFETIEDRIRNKPTYVNSRIEMLP